MHNIIFLSDQASTGASGMGIQTLLIYLLLFVGLWFLMIAPQRKKQKSHLEMIRSLKNGDHVVTSSGIFGTIVNVKEDRFVLDIGDSTKIEIFKSFIQSKIEKK